MHLEQGLEPKFGNTGPSRSRIDCRYSRLLRSSLAPWRRSGLMTCVRQTGVYESSCRTRARSKIWQHATSRNGFAIRTRPTAQPHACVWDRAATKSQNDPRREEQPRGRRGGAPPPGWLRGMATAALPKFPARSMAPCRARTLSWPEPEYPKPSRSEASKVVLRRPIRVLPHL